MIGFAVLLVACGDDDDASNICVKACDGGTRDGAVGPGGGGGSSAGAGGRGGAGASGRGGSGGTAPAADAGMEPEPPTNPLPMNGDQLSVCDAPADCDKDFGCYDLGPGQGFCTRTCKGDKDCKDIAGATYSCSDDGLCEVDCSGGPPGVDKCPEGLVCTQVSGPGPGGIQSRCKYSASAGTNGNAFSACSLPADCDDGLQCVGAFLTVPGYCTHACTAVAECSERPASGTVVPSCMANACVLSCAGDRDGCPTGMACVETPLFSQCAYQ